MVQNISAAQYKMGINLKQLHQKHQKGVDSKYQRWKLISCIFAKLNPLLESPIRSSLMKLEKEKSA